VKVFSEQHPSDASPDGSIAPAKPALGAADRSRGELR
jgi:hypothetical protein